MHGLNTIVKMNAEKQKELDEAFKKATISPEEARKIVAAEKRK